MQHQRLEFTPDFYCKSVPETVKIIDDMEEEEEWEWFTTYWNAIKSLCLSCNSCLLRCFDSRDNLVPEMFPTSTNMQVIKLFHMEFAIWKHFALAMELLRKSPKICELEIAGRQIDEDGDEVSYDHDEVASRLLEDPDSYSINQDLEMLHTVKIETFTGSKLEMLFVKTLLSKSPALDKVIIMPTRHIDDSDALEITREMLRFPRASQKAQIVFLKYKYLAELVHIWE